MKFKTYSQRFKDFKRLAKKRRDQEECKTRTEPERISNDSLFKTIMQSAFIWH